MAASPYPAYGPAGDRRTRRPGKRSAAGQDIRHGTCIPAGWQLRLTRPTTVALLSVARAGKIPDGGAWRLIRATKAFAGRRLRLTPDAMAHQRQRVADDGLAVDRL